MTLSAYDLSRGDTEEKQFNNLLAMSAGANIKGLFYGSLAYDPVSLVSREGVTAVVPVPGVALGDIVIAVGLNVSASSVSVTAYVQAAGLVEVRFQNQSAQTRDIASTIIYVIIADMT
jgi:hypothetical protein